MILRDLFNGVFFALLIQRVSASVRKSRYCMPLSLLSNTLLAWRFFKKIYLLQTIDALLMPLDDPTIAAIVPVDLMMIVTLLMIMDLK